MASSLPSIGHGLLFMVRDPNGMVRFLPRVVNDPLIMGRGRCGLVSSLLDLVPDPPEMV